MRRSLIERLPELEDPRDRRGRQFPLVGLLTPCAVARAARAREPAERRVYLLRRANHPSAPAARRATVAQPELALAVLNRPDTISA